jgi:hypothetical protein
MNLREKILHLLMIEMKCEVREDAGILYITTPSGEKWDMTRPMSKEEQKEEQKEELIRGAARAIEIVDNEDELEDYSAKLDKAREKILEGHCVDIINWVRYQDMHELKSFLESVLGLEKMTLGMLRNRFGSYLEG